MPMSDISENKLHIEVKRLLQHLKYLNIPKIPLCINASIL